MCRPRKPQARPRRGRRSTSEAEYSDLSIRIIESHDTQRRQIVDPVQTWFVSTVDGWGFELTENGPDGSRPWSGGASVLCQKCDFADRKSRQLGRGSRHRHPLVRGGGGTEPAPQLSLCSVCRQCGTDGDIKRRVVARFKVTLQIPNTRSTQFNLIPSPLTMPYSLTVQKTDGKPGQVYYP